MSSATDDRRRITALEWMEEETLRTTAGVRSRSEPIALDALDLVKDLDVEERRLLAPLPRGSTHSTPHPRRTPPTPTLADFEECHLAFRRASAHAGDATRVARSQALHLFRARAGTADSCPERRPAPAKRPTQPPSKCGPSIHQDGIAPKGIFRELTLNHRLACSLNVWT